MTAIQLFSEIPRSRTSNGTNGPSGVQYPGAIPGAWRRHRQSTLLNSTAGPADPTGLCQPASRPRLGSRRLAHLRAPVVDSRRTGSGPGLPSGSNSAGRVLASQAKRDPADRSLARSRDVPPYERAWPEMYAVYQWLLCLAIARDARGRRPSDLSVPRRADVRLTDVDVHSNVHGDVHAKVKTGESAA